MWSGAYYGYSLSKGKFLPTAACAAAGLILLGCIFNLLYKRQSSNIQTRIKFALPGLLIGFFFGGAQLSNMGYENITLQYAGGMFIALAWSAVMGLLVGGFVIRMKEKDRYLSYRLETLWVFFMGLFGTLLGQYITFLIKNRVIPLPLPESWTIAAYGTSITFILWLLFSLPLGFMFAANRTRPVVGGVMTLFGGLMVLWIGLNLAPILFAPKSGLYWSGLVIGLSMCTISIFAMAYPRSHVPIGAITIILSILSIIGAGGGLIIGCLSGILGGSLMVGWDGLKQEAPVGQDAVTPQLPA